MCEHCRTPLTYVLRGNEFYWRDTESRPGKSSRTCEPPHAEHAPDWDGARYVADL